MSVKTNVTVPVGSSRATQQFKRDEPQVELVPSFWAVETARNRSDNERLGSFAVGQGRPWVKRNLVRALTASENVTPRTSATGRRGRAGSVQRVARLAGPLFSEAERSWLDMLAARLRAEGFDCWSHTSTSPSSPMSASRRSTGSTPEGLRSANALVAWLDGAMVNNGTACEIGMFAELVRSDSDRCRRSLRNRDRPTTRTPSAAGHHQQRHESLRWRRHPVVPARIVHAIDEVITALVSCSARSTPPVSGSASVADR